METKDKKDKTPEVPQETTQESAQETPQEATQESVTLQADAEALMKMRGTTKAYYVGGYWFSREDYAEAHAKMVGEMVKTFTK